MTKIIDASVEDLASVIVTALSNTNSSSGNTPYNRYNPKLTDKERFKEQLKHEDILDAIAEDRYIDAFKAEQDLQKLKLKNLRKLAREAKKNGDTETEKGIKQEIKLLKRQFERDNKEKNLFTETEKEITKAVSKIKDF